MGIAPDEVPPSILARIAGPLVVAAIVAIGGGGINTWLLADRVNSQVGRIEKRLTTLENFMTAGKRCTLRDCQRIEAGLHALAEELDSHTGAQAHREAAMRLEQLERQLLRQRGK